MIQQLLDRDFILRHLRAFGTYLDQEIRSHERGDAGALDRARIAGLSGDDLRTARAALENAQTDPKASELRPGQQVFLPPQATASALQSVLEQQLLSRRPAMIGSPGPLRAGSQPIADLSIAAAAATETV